MPYAGTFQQFKSGLGGKWKNLGADALQAAYRRVSGTAPAAQPTPAPPIPRFTPGTLDEPGQVNDNNMRAIYNRTMGMDGGKGSIDLQYDEAEAQLNQQLPYMKQAYDDSLRNNASNVAARGMSQGGIKTMYDARSQASYDRNVGDIRSGLARLIDQRSGAKADAALALRTGQASNVADANSRQMAAIAQTRRDNGIYTADPSPASAVSSTAPQAPKVTYQQFASKAGANWSTAQKQAAYRRIYGG
jgi:hypothetical protein